MNKDNMISKAFEKADFSKETSFKEHLRERLFGKKEEKRRESSRFELDLEDVSMLYAAGNAYAGNAGKRHAEKRSGDN